MRAGDSERLFILYLENTFYIERTHSISRYNTFYVEKTHSTYALGDDPERFLSLLHQERRHHCSNCDAWFRV
jgi:hypothetical protein